MRIVTQRELTRAELTRPFHPFPGVGEDWNRRAKAMFDAFAKLDPETASPQEIGAIRVACGFSPNADLLLCDECGAARDALVRFGSEPDYEERWQDLCGPCLLAGAGMVIKDPVTS